MQDKLPPGFYLLCIFNIHSLTCPRMAQGIMSVCPVCTFTPCFPVYVSLSFLGNALFPDMEYPSSADFCQLLPATAPSSQRCHLGPLAFSGSRAGSSTSKGSDIRLCTEEKWPGLAVPALFLGLQLVVVLLVLKGNCVIAYSCSWEIE